MSSPPPSPLQTQSDSATRPCCPPDKIFVIFASQTGQADSISEFIFDQFISPTGTLRAIRDRLGEQAVRRLCASKYDTILDDFLEPKNRATLQPGSYLAIIVASTTGQGDAPDTANKFSRWIRRLKRSGSKETLQHLSYALLGLGDTNYDNFANFGHLLDQHLTHLGAQQYVPADYADDATGLELVTEPFIEKLTQTLLDHFGEAKPATVSSASWKQAPKAETATDQNETEKSAPTAPESTAKPPPPSPEMNINRPVVSSCACLSSSDKRTLSDLCRQLVEPSESLRTVPLDDLALPKIAFAPGDDDLYSCLLTGSQVYVNEPSDLNKNLVSLCSFLQSKVPSGTAFGEGTVKFNRKLSTDSESPKLCCHREKIVVECDVQYRVPSSSESPPFVPGDAFGLYTSNLLADVYQVLSSVFVKDSTHRDDPVLLWDYFKVTKKQVYITLSDKSIVELLPYLVFGIDLRTIPKKVALCHLASFTTDEQQKRRLLELSSRQGNLEYQNVILAHKVTMCDILRLFDSCRPPISVFLHYLTAARPRYFSAASVPKDSEASEDGPLKTRSFKILFSVYNAFSHSFMRTSEQLLGLFSGKFFQHYPVNGSKTFLPDLSCGNVWKTLELIHTTTASGQIFDNQDVSLLDTSPFPAYVFPRAIKSFQITGDISKPLILISAGTGIAPFLSLLEQRKALLAQTDLAMGDIYFFFGCRHPYQDFTYASEIVAHSKGDRPLIKHLCLCFSRSSRVHVAKFEAEHGITLCPSHSVEAAAEDAATTQAAVKHVNQLVALHGKEIVELIVEKEAYTYICGDWKKLATGLATTFTSLLSEHYLAEEAPSPTSPAAVKYLKELQKCGRYAVDIWT